MADGGTVGCVVRVAAAGQDAVHAVGRVAGLERVGVSAPDHTPFAPIATGRLLLAPLSVEDAERVFEYRADPSVCLYQTFEPRSLPDALAFIEEGRNPAGTADAWTQFGIRMRDGGLLIGDVGFRLHSEQPGSAEIGVTLAPEHQRRGFAAEALRGLLADLFGALGVHRVFASVDPRNGASMALMQRVGMRQEAHFRESLWFKGEWADDVVFGMLKAEWDRRKGLDTVGEMWKAFLSSGLAEARGAAEAGYTSWHFGTGGAMADELVGLVLAGGKRATAGALWSYEHDGEQIPRPGEYSVIVDGAGVARCVTRTERVEVVPFSEVGEEFAAAEGEGDLSLEYWREGHWKYFTRELAGFDRAPDMDMPVVCERFTVVFR